MAGLFEALPEETGSQQFRPDLPPRRPSTSAWASGLLGQATFSKSGAWSHVEESAAAKEFPHVIFGNPDVAYVLTGLEQFLVLCRPREGQRTSSGAGAGHREHWA